MCPKREQNVNNGNTILRSDSCTMFEASQSVMLCESFSLWQDTGWQRWVTKTLNKTPYWFISWAPLISQSPASSKSSVFHSVAPENRWNLFCGIPPATPPTGHSFLETHSHKSEREQTQACPILRISLCAPRFSQKENTPLLYRGGG